MKPKFEILQILRALEYDRLVPDKEGPDAEYEVTRIRGRLDEILSAGGFEDAERRIDLLDKLPGSNEAREEYIREFGVHGVQRFETGGGKIAYRMPAETFPVHVNNLYLIVDEDLRVLIDAGSGIHFSNEHIARGFEIVTKIFGESRARMKDLDHVIITHAHLDHFGGTKHILDNARPRLWIHDLDAKVLTAFEERTFVASRGLERYIRENGMPEKMRASVMEMYLATKATFSSIRVDELVHDEQLIVNDYVAHHVPGHCPGQICVRVDDVIFTGDHILAGITPHQMPESITSYTGLGTYLDSLLKISRVDGIRLALPAHEEEIYNFYERIDEIARHHIKRLDKVMEICQEPLTLFEICQKMFGDQKGYGKLLAIEEAGAHVEYLVERSYMMIANLRELQDESEDVLKYAVRNQGFKPTTIFG
ncbi:MAG: MBL fold metallo-hydrolase [Planctomycetes bacterium]|nr:MBL fold metallo-hydrolase [Planctomycetota bacterium]